MQTRLSLDGPGTVPATHRLTFAVIGVAAALPPRALRDALRCRAQAARAGGYPAAAAAFDEADCYLARAFQEPQPPDAPAAPGRDQLMELAVHQVRRAFALLPDEHGALRPPAGPPDPALIKDPASLAEDLRALCDWGAVTVGALAADARRHGLHAAESDLRAALSGERFPTPSVTEAIARGCGLPDEQCSAWLAARWRAARAQLPDPLRAGPHLPDPDACAQAALDPQQAESPVQLSALLVELKERCGPSYSEMERLAKRAGRAVSWSRLWAVGSHHAFPTERVLEAFLIGCGMYPPDRKPWHLVRNRLAATRRRPEHTVHGEAAAGQQHPDRSPDPYGARTLAEFVAALQALVHWSGLDLAELTWEAINAGVPVTTDALRYVLVHRVLPGASTLNAFTVGCGLSNAEQSRWQSARARLATLPPAAHRLPPDAVRLTTARRT